MRARRPSPSIASGGSSKGKTYKLHIFYFFRIRSHEHPSENNAFYKIDSDLQEVWEFSHGNVYFVVEKGRESGDFRASPAVDENNTVYIGTKADDKSTFFAINSDGTLKWKNQLGADLDSSPALGKNGFV